MVQAHVAGVWLTELDGRTRDDLGVLREIGADEIRQIPDENRHRLVLVCVREGREKFIPVSHQPRLSVVVSQVSNSSTPRLTLKNAALPEASFWAAGLK